MSACMKVRFSATVTRRFPSLDVPWVVVAASRVNRPLSLGDHVESALFSHGKPRPDANSVRGLPCKVDVKTTKDRER